MEHQRPPGAPAGRVPAAARAKERAQFKRRFKAVRVAVLLGLLCSVVAWGLRVELRRRARTSWRRTVPVEVVLLRNGYVPEPTLGALRDSLPRLEAALAAELARYRPEAPPPFSFQAVGTVSVQHPPPDPPDAGQIWDRAVHYLRLWRYLDRAHRRGGLRLHGDSVRLYVVVEPPRNRTRFVEGFGGGDIGVVRTAMDGTNIDQALLAMGHELLHCVGAADKYDDHGHALDPDGLAEPARTPRYPQRYAEIMVGEVALDRGKGQTIETLAEVRVGPITASEIGWTAP